MSERPTEPRELLVTVQEPIANLQSSLDACSVSLWPYNYEIGKGNVELILIAVRNENVADVSREVWASEESLLEFDDAAPSWEENGLVEKREREVVDMMVDQNKVKPVFSRNVAEYRGLDLGRKIQEFHSTSSDDSPMDLLVQQV